MAFSSGWIEAVQGGIKDSRWDGHDEVIRTEVGLRNAAFVVTPGFSALPWLMVKAMVWVESGGPDNPAWSGRAMQIGNPGDPALAVLLSGKEGADLILSPDLANSLKAGKIGEPAVNIRAGIAYLYTRLAKFDVASIPDRNDGVLCEHAVVKGESLASIAKQRATTVDELLARNPGAKAAIQPGQKLRFRKATMGLVISGWRRATSSEVAAKYNGGGDPDYSAKLDYVLEEVFTKLEPKTRVFTP